MRTRLLIVTILLWASMAAVMMQAQAQSRRTGGGQPPREVSVTFDDLPFVSVARQDLAAYQEVTDKLLATITANRIPIIGFVNESKLYQNGQLEAARVRLLQRWLDAGLELGNHTFSHPDLNTTPLDAYKANVLRGEEVTSTLLRQKGMKLRYFRHPFLHTGIDLETKRGLEAFLHERGYAIAPVTIDNSEWIFAAAYARASARGDQQMMRRIGAAYLPYMESKFEYFEKQSVALFGYEMKQILLLHANALNADYFGGLVQLIKRRGYRFITLDEALTDRAYASADAYTGRSGITWLHRWALTADKRAAIIAAEPKTPAFVLKEAGVDSE